MDRDILINFTLCLIVIILIRGFTNLVALFSNLKWLKNRNANKLILPEKLPFFVICIPMLREQKILKDTLEYFANINYPTDLYKVFIVTTEKETLQKEQRRVNLASLAVDLHDDKDTSFLKNKYLGLISSTAIEELHKNFSGCDFQAIMTRLENIYDDTPTTQELALEFSSDINSRLKTELIHVVHYPQTEGVMSHQIAYLVDELKRMKTYDDSFLVVYNADSRPNPETLTVVAEQINQYLKINGVVPNVLQQSSLFTLNYDCFTPTFSGYTLKAAAMFQTKWTLVHELSRFRRQSVAVTKRFDNPINIFLHTKLSHCVGHGLFARLSLLYKENKLLMETVNEDLPFGFYQCCKREPILPLPLLENSESPETVKSLFNQKKVWFWPYLEYSKCKQLVLNNGSYKSKFEVSLLTLEGQVTGLIWFFQSIVFILSIIISIILQSWVFVCLWILSVAIYWFIPTLVIYSKLNWLEKIASNKLTRRSVVDYCGMSIAGLFIIGTHSLGPARCLNENIRIKLFGYKLVKNKTER
jgi:hypothetical protein